MSLADWVSFSIFNKKKKSCKIFARGYEFLLRIYANANQNVDIECLCMCKCETKDSSLFVHSAL